MEDLITKLQDLNRLDPLHFYNILIIRNGGFELMIDDFYHETSIECEDAQELREEMYRIILKTRA